MIYPVILSGGSGTRLWPMSRSLYPKQLLALFGDTSLLQQTVRRVAGQPGFAPPLIVANEEHRFIIAEQLREIGVEPTERVEVRVDHLLRLEVSRAHPLHGVCGREPSRGCFDHSSSTTD